MLDVKGLSCPEPLLLLGQALMSNPENLEVVANEAHTVQNLLNFAEDKNYTVEIKQEAHETHLFLRKKK